MRYFWYLIYKYNILNLRIYLGDVDFLASYVLWGKQHLNLHVLDLLFSSELSYSHYTALFWRIFLASWEWSYSPNLFALEFKSQNDLPL